MAFKKNTIDFFDFSMPRQDFSFSFRLYSPSMRAVKTTKIFHGLFDLRLSLKLFIYPYTTVSAVRQNVRTPNHTENFCEIPNGMHSMPNNNLPIFLPNGNRPIEQYGEPEHVSTFN